jgi:hypothetical protein
MRPIRAPNRTLQHRLDMGVGNNTNGSPHFRQFGNWRVKQCSAPRSTGMPDCAMYLFRPTGVVCGAAFPGLYGHTHEPRMRIRPRRRRTSAGHRIRKWVCRPPFFRVRCLHLCSEIPDTLDQRLERLELYRFGQVAVRVELVALQDIAFRLGRCQDRSGSTSGSRRALSGPRPPDRPFWADLDPAGSDQAGRSRHADPRA